jgi:RNA polymerase sigma-70 factor (sigma-E family)
VSFETYVVTRGPALLRFGYVLTGDRQLSEDLVQEALATVFRRWSRIRSLDHPDAYVRRIVVNDFLSWKRRKASRLLFTAEPPERELPQREGNDPAAAYADRDAMWHLLSQLPRQQRAVLVLRYYEGWTDEQIARVIRCSAVTVRAHASKALARLRSAATTPSILNGAD